MSDWLADRPRRPPPEFSAILARRRRMADTWLPYVTLAYPPISLIDDAMLSASIVDDAILV